LVLRFSYWAANLDIFGACHYNTTLSAIPANNGPGILTPEVSRTPPFFFPVNVSQLALESVQCASWSESNAWIQVEHTIDGAIDRCLVKSKYRKLAAGTCLKLIYRV
jgi:hypothetical protein